MEAVNENRPVADRVLVVGPDRIDALIRALGAPVRRRICELLRGAELNVNEIARESGVSQSTAVSHVQALEEAGLITCRTIPARKGVQKVCTSSVESAVILLAASEPELPSGKTVTEMPVGLFFDHEVHPTCGIASETGIIGYQDDAQAFVDPHRAAAQIIWFEHGYVEYRLPVERQRTNAIRSLAVSVEICSEFPGHRADWPSDITVWMNGSEIGTFRSPGDPGDRRGHLNPGWWGEERTQYGYLKEWRVTNDGSFVDGVRSSEVCVADMDLESGRNLTLRFGIKEDAEFRGGMNLFGRRFGNYAQDIRLVIESSPQQS